MKLLLQFVIVMFVTSVFAVTPKPVDHIDGEELSVGTYITVTSLPASSNVKGPFEITADSNGHIQIRFISKPTEFEGDFVCSTKTAVKPGEKHHLEFSFSRLRKRVAIYLDGKFEWENDNHALPRLKGGKILFEKDGGVVTEQMKVYPYELESEQLTPAADGKQTIADEKKAKADAVKRNVFKDIKGPAAYYSIPHTSQEIFLPYDLPRRGTLGGEVFQFAAPDQQVSSDVLIFALKAPLTVLGAKVSDLKAKDGKVFSAKDIDVKIVKRWYRAGGAWLTYHADPRQRNLTPDLLMYDDAAIKVDELAKRNYLRLSYPEGDRYVDVSDPEREPGSWNDRIPFYDAKTLQPVTIPEWGRNQQFTITFTVSEKQAPGIYRGEIEFTGAVNVPVTFEVLPITLPKQGSPINNLDVSYITLNNSFPAPIGSTFEKRLACTAAAMKEVYNHRMFHTDCMWDTPELARLAREAGFPEPDRLFTHNTGNIPDWRAFYPGRNEADLTLADKDAVEKVIMRGLIPALVWQRETFKIRPEVFMLFYSESSAYGSLVKAQEGRAEMARKAGYTVWAHTMRDDLVRIDGDVMDKTATTTVFAKYARQWNAIGNELLNYADPFPSSENPEYFRRRTGVMMYKCGFAGDMMHECYRRMWPFHEWQTEGEIGNYRNFELCYPSHDRHIWKLAYDGIREAMNDVRYFTALKIRAVKYRNSENEELRREAKRQLLWLELLDENTADLDMLRAAVADRIMIMDRLIEKEGK